MKNENGIVSIFLMRSIFVCVSMYISGASGRLAIVCRVIGAGVRLPRSSPIARRTVSCRLSPVARRGVLVR